MPGIAVIIYDSHFEETPEGKTKVNNVFTITGLSRHGNAIIEKLFSEKNLLKESNRSREELEYYLKTGKMLDTKFKSSMFD